MNEEDRKKIEGILGDALARGDSCPALTGELIQRSALARGMTADEAEELIQQLVREGELEAVSAVIPTVSSRSTDPVKELEATERALKSAEQAAREVMDELGSAIWHLTRCRVAGGTRHLNYTNAAGALLLEMQNLRRGIDALANLIAQK